MNTITLLTLGALLASCATQQTTTKSATTAGMITVTFTRKHWCMDDNNGTITVDGRPYRIGDGEASISIEVRPGAHTFEYNIGLRSLGHWREKEITKPTTIELPCSHVRDNQRQQRRE